MSTTFDPLELLQLAIDIEEQGVAFYDGLSAATKDASVQMVLRKLGDDEKRHAAEFKKIYEDVAQSDNLHDYLKDHDVDALFHQYAQYEIFREGPKPGFNAREAIHIGIDTEEATIHYYESLLPFANEGLKPVLERLIEEETGHYETLKKMLY